MRIHHQRGDIAVYTALTIALIMAGSAIMLGVILARQIVLTKDLVASERAFYAANSAQEELYYQLATGTDLAEVEDGIMTYVTDHGVSSEASYEGTAHLTPGGAACGETIGTYPAAGGEQRRLEFGPPGC